MKYLLLLLALGVIIFLLGAKRAASRREAPQQPRKPAAPPPPKHMVACAHCGMHLPQDEALPGRDGVFCGPAHRAAHEAEHGA